MQAYWIVSGKSGTREIKKRKLDQGVEEYGPYVSFHDAQMEWARLAAQVYETPRYWIEERAVEEV
jgi:hypothetical protein